MLFPNEIFLLPHVAIEAQIGMNEKASCYHIASRAEPRRSMLKNSFDSSGSDNSTALGKEFQTSDTHSATEYHGVYSVISWTTVPFWARFFQMAFSGTAATIVSGAVAERIQFNVFLVFSFLLVAFFYPVHRLTHSAKKHRSNLLEGAMPFIS